MSQLPSPLKCFTDDIKYSVFHKLLDKFSWCDYCVGTVVQTKPCPDFSYVSVIKRQQKVQNWVDDKYSKLMEK